MAVSFRFDLRRFGKGETGKLFPEPRLNVIEPAFDLGLHVRATEEFCPEYSSLIAHIILVDAQYFDRRKADAGPAKDVNLHRNVVIVMFLHATTALHLAHPPIPVRQTFQHIDADPHTGMLECSLEDRRHRMVSH